MFACTARISIWWRWCYRKKDHAKDPHSSMVSGHAHTPHNDAHHTKHYAESMQHIIEHTLTHSHSLHLSLSSKYCMCVSGSWYGCHGVTVEHVHFALLLLIWLFYYIISIPCISLSLSLRYAYAALWVRVCSSANVFWCVWVEHVGCVLRDASLVLSIQRYSRYARQIRVARDWKRRTLLHLCLNAGDPIRVLNERSKLLYSSRWW